MKKYVAFISYRHKKPDSAVAAALHKRLERYRIPKDIASKCGRKTLGRVFRDQEELALSSSLPLSIREALDASEYLIVVCTPDTPQSKWIQEEIEYFLTKNEKSKVLIILADGETNISLPSILIETKTGIKEGSQRYHPLAADVRSKSKNQALKRLQVLKKLKFETNRIVAGIITCEYDDLQKRFKQYQQKKILFISTLLIVVLLFFLGYALFKNTQISDKNVQLEKAVTELQINESKYLSEKSAILLDSGERSEAIRTALAALPSGNSKRPVLPEAEMALSKALYAYKTDVKYREDRSFNIQGGSNISSLIQSEDGRYFVYTNCRKDIITAVDTYTGNQLWSFSATDFLSDINDIYSAEIEKIFFNDHSNDVIITLPRKVVCINILSGTSVWETNYGDNTENYVSLNNKGAVFCKQNNTLYVIISEGDFLSRRELILQILNASDGKELQTISLLSIDKDALIQKSVVSDDGRLYLCSVSKRDNNDKQLVQVNTVSHEVAYISQHKFSESFFSYAPGSEDIILCYINKSITSNPDSLSIYRLNNEAGFPEKWSSTTTADLREIDYCDHDIYLGAGLYYYASEDVMVIACVLSKSINLYSCTTGALFASRDFSTRIKSAVQADSKEQLFLFMEDGLVDILHLDTNLLQSELPFSALIHLGFNPTNMISFMGKTVVVEHNNNPVVSVFREKRDKNYRVIASKLRYLNNEYVKYFPEKEVLAIITNQNNEKCLVLIDKRSAQIINSIVLGEGSYTIKEGIILPDNKLLIKSSNPNNVWLVNLDKCRIELIEETTNKKGIIYKNEYNVYIAFVGDNNFELYSYFDGANHIKSWTCSDGVLPMPELLVANSNYIVLPTTTFPDYDTLAVSIFDYHGNQKRIKVYDLTDGDLLYNILAPKTKLSQKKSLFAFFDEHGRFCVVDLKDGETIISVKDPKKKVLDFAFIKEDSEIVCTYKNGEMEFIDIDSGSIRANLRLNKFSDNDAKILAVDDETGICIVRSQNSNAIVYDTFTYKARLYLDSYLCYLSDSKEFLIQDKSGDLLLYPYYDTEDLIAWGKSFLKEHIFVDFDQPNYIIQE